jgi:hypothetical protein
MRREQILGEGEFIYLYGMTRRVIIPQAVMLVSQFIGWLIVSVFVDRLWVCECIVSGLLGSKARPIPHTRASKPDRSVLQHFTGPERAKARARLYLVYERGGKTPTYR